MCRGDCPGHVGIRADQRVVCHSNRYIYCNADGNRNRDGNRDRDADRYCDADRYGNRNRYRNRDGDPNCDRYPDADAHPLPGLRATDRQVTGRAPC
jgi:hypothetical protein